MNQSVPIVLAIDEETRARVDGADKVALAHKGTVVGTLSRPEVFEHRQEERCARQFACTDRGHPCVAQVMEAGPWLIGGDVMALGRVRWEDGLDEYRLTPNELRAEFERRGADAVYAFQLRNPIHNGHALLMADTRERLLARGYRRPLLLLHPLGGWTKEDDVPLPVRMRQHKAVLEVRCGNSRLGMQGPRVGDTPPPVTRTRSARLAILPTPRTARCWTGTTRCLRCFPRP